MPDVIHLLPDSVANQIAAGEVIQRPASAVKELLENSIDSGADDIKLIIKEAGKLLIQVIDNGCGMSETDARMAFERHATSKIKTANDLFAIKTLGFRGEALASMAAIAQMELKTKRISDELGTCLTIFGSEVKNQELCACSNGASISLKNLFYNIPARRKFLKSNTTEIRHIIDEFHRVALVHPEIKFSFFNENRQLFSLAASNLKQRISALFGPAFNNRLVPVEQETDTVSISGFIGKPEFARKTRGEQFFFVNGRFIKHPYLNHAVDSAFRELIPNDSFPTYFIQFSINPNDIDINIHPTKTEINFQNNKVIYSILSSAIKQALGKFNVVQSIDFDVEQSINFMAPTEIKNIKPPEIRINQDYNPFENQGNTQKGYTGSIPNKPDTKGWENLYNIPSNLNIDEENNQQQSTLIHKESDPEKDRNNLVFQIQNKYIVSTVKSGLMIIDQHRAHSRILFEEYVIILNSGKGASQQLLFPETIQFSASDTEILKSILGELKSVGFEIEEFGDRTFIVNGTPVDLNNITISDVLESIIENYKKNLQDTQIDKKVNFARSMAINMSVRYGKKLEQEELLSIIEKLFACKVPEVSTDGMPIIKIINTEEIDQRFNR